MNGKELYHEDGTATGVWFCSECRMTRLSREEADTCCMCIDCETEKLDIHKSLCKACSDKFYEELNYKAARKLEGMLEKSELVDNEYGFFWDGQWYRHVEDLHDERDSDEGGPEFCFAARPVYFQKWDVHDTRVTAEEQYGCEDIDIEFDCYDVLAAAFEEFNKENDGNIICYEADYTKKVRVRE